MRHSFAKALVLLLGLSLAACSSNTRQENQTVGTVAGAVVGGLAGSAIGAGTGQIVAIGVGAVAGAILGNAVGGSMDSTDSIHIYRAMDHNPANRVSSWTNPNSHRTYTMVPTSGMMTVQGNPNCRKFRATILVDGQQQVVNGVACRQADGSWMAMR